jgi:hypothetical protein
MFGEFGAWPGPRVFVAVWFVFYSLFTQYTRPPRATTTFRGVNLLFLIATVTCFGAVFRLDERLRRFLFGREVFGRDVFGVAPGRLAPSSSSVVFGSGRALLR